MKNNQIYMVPGPVTVPQEILDVYRTDYGPSDLDRGYLDLYNETEANLQQILGTKEQVVIQTGEGMLALWSALKSCLRPGDKVLAVATGVFGYGIGDMAKSIGASVETVGFGYDETIDNLKTIEQKIKTFQPKMITAVHCETPSGTLNPIAGLGRLKQTYKVPLFYADAVASAGGVPVLSDEWQVDLALGGSQKCLSAPPCMSFLSVSKSAWEIIENIGYEGYDALLPYRDAQANFYFPYTPYWHGTAALNRGAEMLLEEGLANSYARHEAVAKQCRERLKSMGLKLFPSREAVPSPTVTAVMVPDFIGWKALDRQLREKGLVVGGSYGPLHEKVFRIGHMGSQADAALVNQALDILENVLQKNR